MKNSIKHILQFLLGYERYLYWFSLFIIKTLPWKKNESDFVVFNSLIKGDGLILDIGANIGVMSYHLAINHPQSTIIAIEPIPSCFHTIQRIKNRYSLHNINLLQTALGNTEGRIQMNIPIIGNAKQQGLSHIADIPLWQHEDGEILECPITTVDSLIDQCADKLPLLAIKMDVENYESHVIAGALRTLQHYKPIVYCELWDNDNRYESIQLMESIGYTTMVCQHNQLIHFQPELYKGLNFFFIHQ